MKTENKYILSISLLMLGIALFSLFCGFPIWLSFTLISIINLYLFSLLFIATTISDGKDWLPVHAVLIIPSRFVGLLLFFIFLASFIILFGSIYLKFGEVQKSIIKTPFDAVYYSTLTTTTLGFQDLSKDSNWPKAIMLYQILSSVHLFLGSFPLLLSRINKI